LLLLEMLDRRKSERDAYACGGYPWLNPKGNSVQPGVSPCGFR
jgi:hypothetical protein